MHQCQVLGEEEEEEEAEDDEVGEVISQAPGVPAGCKASPAASAPCSPAALLHLRAAEILRSARVISSVHHQCYLL